MLDLDKMVIDWYVEDQIVASSKLSRLVKQGFKVVFSMFNTDDSVLLNEEDWKDRLRLGKFDKASYFLEPQKSSDKFGKSNKKVYVVPSETEYVKPEKLFEAPSPAHSVAYTVDTAMMNEQVGRIKKQRFGRFGEKKRWNNDDDYGFGAIPEKEEKVKEPSEERRQYEL